MFQSIYQDVRQIFKSGHMVNKIILINVAVWLLVNLVFVFTRYSGGDAFYQMVLQNLAIPSEAMELLKKPWTVISHMFLHKGFWHILWNMLLFFWFGKIVGDLIGDRYILPIYLYGGLFGAIVFVITTPGGIAMGASAAVMATVLAAAFISPDYVMRLILIGDVRIKYIALAIVVLDIIGTAGNVNTGGHFAHLGGAFFGWMFIALLRKGTDMAIPFNYYFEKLVNLLQIREKARKSPLKVRYKSKSGSQKKGNRSSDDSSSFQEQLDRILEKIKEKGYDNLTEEEKEFLYQASKK